MKNALKLATTINIVIAVISAKFGNYFLTTLLSILSAIYIVYSEKTITYLYNKKTIIIILSLINLILNPISGVIMFVGQDKLLSEYNNSDKKEEKPNKLTKEEKQISNLLNIGIGLILLSGIILTTTQYKIMPDIVKLIILLIISSLFMTLSIITGKKLNIKTLEKKYWLLSMVFIILTILANGYLGTISKWFSFIGDGKKLYIALTSIIIALLSQITEKKYENNIYKNISHIGIITSIAFILAQMNIPKEIILILTNIVLLITNIIQKKELSKYLIIFTSIISIMIITESTQIILQTLLALTTIINITKTTIKETQIEGLIGPVIINTTIIITILNIQTTLELTTTMTTIILLTLYSIIYLLNLLKIEINPVFKTTANVITNLILLGLLMINIDNNKMLTTIASITTITSIINYYKDTIKYEKILLPIKIVILIITIISLLKDIISPIYILITLYIILFTIYKISKEKIKKISIVLYYIIFGITLIANEQIIPSFINILAAGITLALVNKENNPKHLKISYVTLLLTIAATLLNANILRTTLFINSIILLLIYITLTIITKEEKQISKINYLAIILPLITLIEDQTLNYEIQKIIKTTMSTYIIILIDLFLIKKPKDRNILTTILTSLAILEIIFIASWEIGLYVGIYALILIIIGTIKKDYKALQIEGIVISIINILLQFQYILKELPLWIYTLFAGLTIIGLVTYKIIKDKE